VVLSTYTPTPSLRDPKHYASVIQEVDKLRAKGHGYQGKADDLLKANGYTEGVISFLLYFYSLLQILLLFFDDLIVLYGA